MAGVESFNTWASDWLASDLVPKPQSLHCIGSVDPDAIAPRLSHQYHRLRENRAITQPILPPAVKLADQFHLRSQQGTSPANAGSHLSQVLPFVAQDYPVHQTSGCPGRP